MEEVLEINGWIKEAELDAAAPEEGQEPVDLNQRRLRRVFNDGTFDRGGRLFGGFWQNMPAKQRRMDLLVSGEPGVELDYGQMALRLLYAMVGAEPTPGDLYDISELTAQLYPGESIRDGIKKIINAALSSERGQFRVPQCPATIVIAGPATIMVAGESARRGLSAGGAQPRPETGPCGHGLPVAPVHGGFGPA